MDIPVLSSFSRGIHWNPIFLSLVLLLLTLYLLRGRRSSSFKLPPSPPKLPVIGNFHQLIGTQFHRELKRLADEHGPVMLIHVGTSPCVVVSSSDKADEATNKEMFSGKPQQKAVSSLWGSGHNIAFSPCNEFWRQARKICVTELLSQKKVREFKCAREQEVSDMIDRISAVSADRGLVDISDISETVSNNVLSRCAFGRLYTKEDGNKISFAKLARKTFDLLSSFCFEDVIPWLRWLDRLTGFSAELKRTSDELNKFLDQVIEEHQVSRSHNQESEKKDLFDILLDHEKEQTLDIGLTREDIKAILLDMFVAGTDSTAATTEWAMLELFKNPRTLKKAQEEGRKVVGAKPKISEDDTDQMRFLKCVVKETLRLHPILNGREYSSSATTKLGGYDIPPKTAVLVNTWAVHTDPTVWDRAEEFVLERFKESSIEFKGQGGKYLPFGGGKRICPGISFALVEAEYVLANLLYWFDWKLPDGVTAEDLDMIDVYKGTINKKTPLHLVAFPRCV